MDFVTLSIRSPKGGGGGHGGGGGGHSSSSGGGKSSSSSKSGKSSSSSKSKSKTPKVKGGGLFSSDDDGEGIYGLPLWARIVIIVLILMIVLFIVAFIHYAIKENKKRVANKHKFRWGKVLWNAFKVATLLGIFTWLFKKVRGSKGGKKPNTSSYAKIEEGQSMQNLAPIDSHPPQYQPAAQKYEPMGYGPGYYAPAVGSVATPQPQTTGVVSPMPQTAYAPPLGNPPTPATGPMPTPPPQQYQQFSAPTATPPPAMGASAEYYSAGVLPTPPSTVASVPPAAPPVYQGGSYQPPPMAPPPQGYYQPPPHQ